MTNHFRPATHAGSWYTASSSELGSQMDEWLRVAVEKQAQAGDLRPVKAIISPHAGYSYSGPIAAHAFARSTGSQCPKRVFVLGPSHHAYVQSCALPSKRVYQTPFGDFHVDQTVVESLEQTGAFVRADTEYELAEHSIEMQLPILMYALKRRYADQHMPLLVPVIVGALDKAQEQQFGRLFAPYLMDPENFFVISSDFCHFGERFRYCYVENAQLPLHKSIEELDRKGMELIEQLDAEGFHHYLKQTGNTICGRHPIAVLLRAINELQHRLPFKIEFIAYGQSNAAQSKRDSSVSYAAACATVVGNY